jgi:serine/threonine-protein kinase
MTQSQRTLNNRYELLAKLGDGGMAVVFKALDHKLNRVVAIKVLRESYVSDQQFLARFTREAQSAASLSHPNIVDVYDVGEDGDIHFIVMEYIEGKSLKEYIVNNAPLPPVQAIQFAIQINNAIGYAHSKGLIHRDIKPQNILLTPENEIKVTDFGIAKGLGDATLTQAGFTLGTVHYFSPEQAQGRPVVAQSDLYSIGIVLFEMLTGRIPFESDNPVALALKHIEEAPPSPRRFNPSVSPALEQIVLKALAKNPNQRFSSAAAFAQALKDVETASAKGTMAVPARPPTPNPAAFSNTIVENDFAEPNTPPSLRRPPQSGSNNFGRTTPAGGYETYPDGRRRPPLQPQQQGYQAQNYEDEFYDNRGRAAQRYNGNNRPLQYSGQNSRPVPLPVNEYDDLPQQKRSSGCAPWIIGGLLLVMLGGLIFALVLLFQTQNKPNTPTVQPTATATLGPAVKVDVPDLKNKTQAEAEAALKQAGLDIGTTKQQFDDKVESGRVIGQSVAAKAKVDKGSKIDLVISSGVDTVELPQKFVNTGFDDTKRAIENLGLKTQRVEQPSDSIGNGAVIKTDPEGGSGVRIARSTVVKIFVSTGPLPTATPIPPTATPVPPTATPIPPTATPKVLVTVPGQLIGKKQADVVKTLTDLGLVVDVQLWNQDEIKRRFPGDTVALDTWNTLNEGDVLGTDPVAGTKLEKGAKITVAVKKK